MVWQTGHSFSVQLCLIDLSVHYMSSFKIYYSFQCYEYYKFYLNYACQHIFMILAWFSKYIFLNIVHFCWAGGGHDLDLKKLEPIQKENLLFVFI